MKLRLETEYGAIEKLKSLVESKLDQANKLYDKAAGKMISDPKVFDLFSQKADNIISEIKAMRSVASLFGVKFDIIHTLDAGIKISMIKVVKNEDK